MVGPDGTPILSRCRHVRTGAGEPTEPDAGQDPTVAPLAPGQRRQWLLARLFPNGVADARPIVLQFDGELDLAVLQRALDALVARHPALRTTISERDDGPMQRVGPALGWPIAAGRLRRKRTGRDDDAAQLLRVAVDDA